MQFYYEPKINKAKKKYDKMEITVAYKKVGKQEIDKLTLLPHEYFDPLLERETTYSIHATPKFIFPYEYVDCALNEIVFVVLDLKSGDSYTKREMFFWNEGNNSTDYIIEFDAAQATFFEWLITTTVTVDSEGLPVEENLRLYKNENNMWVVKNHSYRTITPVGAEDIVKEMDVHKSGIGFVSGFYKNGSPGINSGLYEK